MCRKILSENSLLLILAWLGFLYLSNLEGQTPGTELSPVGNANVLLGDSFQFWVTLDNTAAFDSGDFGYAPLIEIVLPPEVTFTAADSVIFGPLTPVANILAGIGGEVINPLTDESLTGLPAGCIYLVFQPPVGSMTPDGVSFDCRAIY